MFYLCGESGPIRLRSVISAFLQWRPVHLHGPVRSLCIEAPITNNVSIEAPALLGSQVAVEGVALAFHSGIGSLFGSLL